MTGAAGMLGAATCCARASAPATSWSGWTCPELDITDAARGRRRRSSACGPTRCSTAPPGPTSTAPRPMREQAHAVNARRRRQPRARRRRRRACRSLHVSTDYVFDGEARVDATGAPRPYVESDPTGPRSVYGQTKLDGERQVLAASPRHAVVRSAWLFGAGGRNFADDDARARGRARGGAGRHRPGRLPDLDRPSRPALLGLLEREVAGLVHLAGAGARLLERLRGGDLPPGRGRLPRAGRHQRADGAPGAAPRVVGARVRARRRAAAAAVAGRARRVSRGARLG